MKSSIRIIVLAIVAMIIALPASAQFRFGIKAGVALLVSISAVIILKT